MNIFDALLLVVAVFNVTLGLFVASADRRNMINVSYGLFVLNAGIWCFGLAMFRLTDGLSAALFWATVYYVAALFIAYFFLLFSFEFPFAKTPLTMVRSVLLLLPVVGLVALLEGTSLHIQTIQVESWGKNVLLGPAYYAYSVLFFIFVVWAFANLIIKYRAVDREQRIQIRFVLVGNFLGFVMGMVFNLIFPLLGNYQYIWLGPYFSLIMVSSVGYAIVRHQLLNIKVIGATVVTGVILIVLLLELFLSRTSGEIMLRGIFLAVVAWFCALLVGSVRREVRQKEQLEVMTHELDAANKELARLDQAKSEFLSIASHQLRTPLTAIKGYSSMILDGTYGTMTRKVHGAMDKVFEATERMVALVNDLLDSSRLESGRMKFTFEEVDLGTIAKSVCEELAIKAKEKKLGVACHAAKKGLAKVWVDAMKIRQVMVNYVDNAIKYSDTGTVGVRVEDRGAEVVFAVTDHGWGMTPEEMQFLFKKFSRGRGDTSLIKGTGLGLYVCRRLVEAHGGRVWAESEGKGKGSTFFFALKTGWQPDPQGVYLPKEE